MIIVILFIGIGVGFLLGVMSQKTVDLESAIKYQTRIGELEVAFVEEQKKLLAFQQATTLYMDAEIKNGIARATHE